MNTEGKILIVFFALFIGEIATTPRAFNPLLTYIIRVRNVKFLPNIFGNYTINNYKTSEYISAHFSVNVPSNIRQMDIEVIVIFNRCNPEGINCEYFQTWKLNLCRALSERNQMWSSVLSSIHPTLKCPIKERYYQVNNASLEIGPIVHLYSEATAYQWKILIKYQVDNLFLGGLSFDLSLFGYRKRIK